MSYVGGKYCYIYFDYDSEKQLERKNYFWRPSDHENDYVTQPQLWLKYVD